MVIGGEGQALADLSSSSSTMLFCAGAKKPAPVCRLHSGQQARSYVPAPIGVELKIKHPSLQSADARCQKETQWWLLMASNCWINRLRGSLQPLTLISWRVGGLVTRVTAMLCSIWILPAVGPFIGHRLIDIDALFRLVVEGFFSHSQSHSKASFPQWTCCHQLFIIIPLSTE